MKKTKRVHRNSGQSFRSDEERMETAHKEYLGKEAKFDNIMAKNGSVPAQVRRELAEAENEYNYRKALWKDSR